MTRKYAHASTVIDIFGEYLTDEQILELENPQQASADSYLLYRQKLAGVMRTSTAIDLSSALQCTGKVVSVLASWNTQIP